MTPLLTVDVDIDRPRAQVLAWWTGFPDEYAAADPKEQPHRIKVVHRSAQTLEVLTWWRSGVGVDLVIPETFRFRDNGDFDVDVTLPLGLRQLDRFAFEDRGTRTHLRVEILLGPRSAVGLLTRPLFAAYARSAYPRTFRHAGRLCEKAAPRAGG